MAGEGRPSMCGRPFGFKGNAAESTTGTSAVMCPALRCGRDDRGPDGFRERALNTSAVSHSAVGWHGISRSSVRPIIIFAVALSPAMPAVQAAVAGRYASPLVIMAHTTRAILLARATAASLRGRRCSRVSSQALACRLPGLTVRTTAVAPSTSNCRSRSLPGARSRPAAACPPSTSASASGRARRRDDAPT